jgi:hypothetical protein
LVWLASATARLVARLARLEIAEIEKYFSNTRNHHTLCVLRDFSRVSILHSFAVFYSLLHSFAVCGYGKNKRRKFAAEKGKASPPPLQGEGPADIARTASSNSKARRRRGKGEASPLPKARKRDSLVPINRQSSQPTLLPRRPEGGVTRNRGASHSSRRRGEARKIVK